MDLDGEGYQNANGKALALWQQVYNKGEVPLIALTDTFTTQAFFQVRSRDASTFFLASLEKHR
jgi:nicotinic acid phosphoribosyltransferase